MSIMNKIKNSASIFNDLDMEIILDEQKLIQDAITTPYERVLKILKQTNSFLSELSNNIKNQQILYKESREMIIDMDWAIERIQSHNLYTYEFNFDELEKNYEENSEMKSFLEFISDYSEAKEIKRRNKVDKLSNSAKVNYIHKGSFISTDSNLHKNVTPATVKRGLIFLSNLEDGDTFKIDIKKTENRRKSCEIIVISPERERDSKIESILRFRKNSNKNLIKTRLSTDKNIFSNSSHNLPSLEEEYHQNKKSKFNQKENSLDIRTIRKNLLIEDKSTNFLTINKLNNNSDLMNKDNKIGSITQFRNMIKSNNEFYIDPKLILSRDFNIHEFDSTYGRGNLLPIIGKTIIKALELTDLINNEKLDNFLTNISKNYNDKAKYHNSIHAADVSLTIATWFINSNLEDITLMTGNDILALITAAFGHDIGHPGYNNNYHINTKSELAITYNDQSVLENYHCSLFFKICSDDECNIFDKISEIENKEIRKRIINMILATDMFQHAKVITVIKPKIVEYKELLNSKEHKENSHNSLITFIQPNSNLIFDEQQKVMDFILHTADLAHNSKNFKTSKKWVDLLMDEFWHQGDMEKSQSLPISFLCDRLTADVPKSQIGFIKGIVAPMFIVLIELLPDLKYLKENIENNLEEWSRINEMKRLMTPNLKRTPMILQKYTPKSPNNDNKNKFGLNLDNIKNFNHCENCEKKHCD